ncbi:circularly permuted type 2 ATP-grasp protein [bacterium]|nr:circularly permuted type 2 ATP-grasp protein [candidate division CSSED10-310 bacterium]
MMQHAFVTEIEKKFDDILRRMETEGRSGAALMNHLAERYLAERCMVSGKPFPTFLKPAFMSPEQHAMVRRVTNVIMRCLEKVSNLFYEDPRYLPLFELAPGEEELARVRAPFSNKIQHARLDAFMLGDDLKFCEFNCDTPGGPGYSDIQVNLLMDTYPLKEIQEEYVLEKDTFMENVLQGLLACYRDYGWDGMGNPRILIHTLFDLDPTMNELEVLQKYFRNRGYDCIIAQPQDCAFENGGLTVAGEPVELVYRRGATAWWISHPEKYRALWDAYKAGAICMANPLNSKLAGKKSLMAVLQTDAMAEKLTDEEKDVVDRHIPWTRLVMDGKTTYGGRTVQLLDFLRENRENMVMKPIGLYGGKNVAIGRDMTDADWESVLKTAIQEKYVAQEYIPIPEIDLPVYDDAGLHFEPKKVNMNFFAFNGEYAGGMARVSDSNIINISAGGGLIPVMPASKRIS